MLGSVPAFPYSTYSDIASNYDYIFGYGVTDVTDYQYTHYATVQVVLQSPNGRTNSTYISQTNSVSGDTYLSWDDGDLGNYVVTTTHWGYCTFMGGYFINGVTTSDSLVTGISVTCGNLVSCTPFNGVSTTCTYQKMQPCTVLCPTDTFFVVYYWPLTPTPTYRARKKFTRDTAGGSVVCSSVSGPGLGGSCTACSDQLD